MKNTILLILAICNLFLMNQELNAQNKYFTLGNQAFDQYQYQVAIENYLLSLKKDDIGEGVQNRIYQRLAQSYAKTGNWDQAAAYYSKFENSGDLNENPEVLYEYAVVLQYLGYVSVAEGYYQRYLEKVPSDTLARQKLDGKIGRASCRERV